VALYDREPVTADVVDAFQKSFPKIEVNSLCARGIFMPSPNSAIHLCLKS
jgi:hypothetical protein